MVEPVENHDTVVLTAEDARMLEKLKADFARLSIPESIHGQPCNEGGQFYRDARVIRFVNHFCGTWYYGHDRFTSGPTIPWMRLREEPDRSHNDVHKMYVDEYGWWQMREEDTE